jgi:hypothetical protein
MVGRNRYSGGFYCTAVNRFVQSCEKVTINYFTAGTLCGSIWVLLNKEIHNDYDALDGNKQKR